MKVLISGAGIAGLSLALRLRLHLRLRQRGLTPFVVERSPRLRDGGYMLGLSGPGLDAAERMGVADALRAARHMPRRLVYVGPAGQERFALDGPAIDRLVGERQFNLMRGDIERVLYEHIRGAVEVRFGASVQSIEVECDGVGVRLSDGTEIGSDLVVGADGLHSRVRALCCGPEDWFVRTLGTRVVAFLLDRSDFPDEEPQTSYSLTEVGRLAALAATGNDLLVAFFIWRTEEHPGLGTIEEELRTAFAGAGWHVPALLDRLSRTADVYFDEVAQVVMPRWGKARVTLLGDAAYAVSLIAGKGATLALAGAVVLADALADDPGGVEAACAAYEARLRPWTEAAQRMARRNMHLFTSANRFQLLVREAVLRLAARPLLAPDVRRLLNREGERL
jgi:2-polyprenyl-6-methoxyphenol hydroxylase-like FAD-dependent oxidoreductase